MKVWSTASQIRKNQVWRKDNDMRRLRLYGNVPLIGFGAANYTRPALGSGRRVSFNVVKNCADSFTAKVTKERPKVSFVTEGGDWEQQQKAEGLQKFIEGQFYEAGVYETAPQVVLDGGGIFGSGFFHPCIEGEGKDAHITADRVFPSELLVDENEGRYGKPRQILRERWIDRCVLEELYAGDEKKLRAIHDAKQGNEPHTGVGGYDSTADQLLVIEAWHIRSGKKAKDGRYTRCIINCTLDDEEWKFDWFPFVQYTKALPPTGYFGISLADELDSIQMEINELMMKIARAHRLLGAAHVLCNRASKVNFSQWDNEQGSKIEHDGPAPTVYVPANIVSPEIYAHLDRLYNRAYEITGTPQAQAQGEVPNNLESGKAQEVYLDVTDQRMQVAIHRYHQMFVELARCWLDLSREIVKNHNEDFGAKAMEKPGKMRRILLRETDLKDEEYILKEWPTDALVDEPAARLAMVERFANAGWIAPDQAKRLLNMPDLEAAQSIEDASYNAVESCIAEMLNEGRYRPPTPLLNLEQAKRQVQLAAIKAWTDGRPEDRQQLLRDWLTDAIALENGFGQQPQMPAMMASAGGTPVPMNPAAGVTPAMAPPPGGPPPGPPGSPPMPMAA